MPFKCISSSKKDCPCCVKKVYIRVVEQEAIQFRHEYKTRKICSELELWGVNEMKPPAKRFKYKKTTSGSVPMLVKNS